MTLDTKLSKAVFKGNGSTTVFPFAFRVWDASQLAVTMTDAAGVSTDVTGDCTVTLTPTGGTVAYPNTGDALPNGATLAIVRNMPFTQGIDLVSASRFDPQVIEDGLDQATAERQQLAEMLERSVILPPTSSQTPEEVVQAIYASRDAAAASASTATTAAADTVNAAKAQLESYMTSAATSAANAAGSAGVCENLAHVFASAVYDYGSIADPVGTTTDYGAL